MENIIAPFTSGLLTGLREQVVGLLSTVQLRMEAPPPMPDTRMRMGRAGNGCAPACAASSAAASDVHAMSFMCARAL